MAIAYHHSNNSAEYRSLLKTRLDSGYTGDIIVRQDLMAFEIDVGNNISLLKY